MKILYVEDSAADADLLWRELPRHLPGAELTVSTTLAEARERLAEPAHFDLLLVDIGLPDGSGLELVREARERELPLAAVVLTGQGDEDLAVAALKAGADDYLAKVEPFHDRLAATLVAAARRFARRQTWQRRGLRVLYAEHQAVDADLTRRHLERHAPHIALEVVGDAAAVLSALPLRAGDACAHDVLLLDYRLAAETGLDLLKRLREQRGLDIPVVMVTGQGSEDVATEAMRLGATDYLVKHANYLIGLPLALENAYHRVAVEREHDRLRRLNAELETRVAERTVELALARDAALRANQAKSDFLAGMSHELRTPMNAVLGFAQLLAHDVEHPLDARQQGFVRNILGAGEHLMGLIDEVLDLARIEAGKAQVAMQPLHLPTLVVECLGLVGPQAQQQGVHLRPLAADAGALGHVRADPARLKQVLLNLLGNAIKYNRRGGEVALSLHLQGDAMRLDVRDTGRGLDAAQRRRLFTPFERLGADTSGVPGAGIGLALSKRLVELMGGEIGVDSEPGRGSTFWIRLARAVPPGQGAGEPAGAADAGGCAGGSARGAAPQRVVYIEDNAVNASLMQAMLGQLPELTLQCLDRGLSGLEAIGQAPPDLVLLDIGLPDIDGFEVLRRLRADARHGAIPVIAVSAQASAADIERGLAAGFDDYLTKPLDLRDVLQRVSAALRR